MTTLIDMNRTHDERVTALATQLKARPSGAKVTIRKATPSHSIRDSAYKTSCHPVDVSNLTQILAIDPVARLATVEGQVLIGDLARATLEQGLLPAVVPEFRKFTVAGLVNGEGIQSSSHRYGIFTSTLESVDLLIADGSVLRTSSTQNTEVFTALPESLGTLGIVTAATIRLVPAKPWVKLSYRRFDTRQGYVAAFEQSLEQHDFHEGVIYGPKGYVLLTGDFIDDPGTLPVFDPWAAGGEYYYQHVRKEVGARREVEEAVETLAYLSRSERGMWWLMECHADFPLLSETAWGRRHMDQVATEIYNKSGFVSSDLSTLERDRCLINQDMGVKLNRLGEGVEWVQQRLNVYPIWNCALRLPEEARSRLETSHLVDIGIYGEPMSPDYRHIRDMRDLQRFVDLPSLWGVSYLTWEEIVTSQKDRCERYDYARNLVRADEAFLHLKDKVVWVDPKGPSPGKIPRWRLLRTFGPRWHFNPLVYLLLGVVYFSKLIFRRPAMAE
jgi:FAD/FMN-containing dehydrogenase